MTKLWVIGWRTPHHKPLYFRGDRRRQIYLPFVSNEGKHRGWVSDVTYARVFDGYPCVDTKNISKHLNTEFIRIYEYTDEIYETQVFRPLVRIRY